MGYGFGWRLMAGSITPVFSDPYTVSYYLFTDSTGAEYRLDQNSSNVWSSKESVYVYYDAGCDRVCTSATAVFGTSAVSPRLPRPMRV